MTQKKVQGYLALSKKATPGPWQLERSHIYGADPERELVCQVLYGRGSMDGATRDLILASRNDAPAIAKALEDAMRILKKELPRSHNGKGSMAGTPCLCEDCNFYRSYFNEDDNAG